jgi:hypothetical protein
MRYLPEIFASEEDVNMNTLHEKDRGTGGHCSYRENH